MVGGSKPPQQLTISSDAFITSSCSNGDTKDTAQIKLFLRRHINCRYTKPHLPNLCSVRRGLRLVSWSGWPGSGSTGRKTPRPAGQTYIQRGTDYSLTKIIIIFLECTILCNVLGLKDFWKCTLQMHNSFQ